MGREGRGSLAGEVGKRGEEGREEGEEENVTYFDLIHVRWPDTCVLFHLFDVHHPIIAHPDGSRFALGQ